MALSTHRIAPTVTAALGMVLGLALGQCSVTPLGATDTGIAQARRAAPAGAELFERECARCHGKRGEGLTISPAVIGAGALAEYPRDDTTSSSPVFATSTQVDHDVAHLPGQSKRRPFRTAQDVYDYVSLRMPLPKSRAGTLGEGAYWAIVNYLLIAHGLVLPIGGVNAANAKGVALRQ